MGASHECLGEFSCVTNESLAGGEGFKHVEKFYAIFFCQKMSQDCRATGERLSCGCRREILANLQCENFTTLVGMSYDSYEKTCEHLATIC